MKFKIYSVLSKQIYKEIKNIGKGSKYYILVLLFCMPYLNLDLIRNKTVHTFLFQLESSISPTKVLEGYNTMHWFILMRPVKSEPKPNHSSPSSLGSWKITHLQCDLLTPAETTRTLANPRVKSYTVIFTVTCPKLCLSWCNTITLRNWCSFPNSKVLGVASTNTMFWHLMISPMSLEKFGKHSILFWPGKNLLHKLLRLPVSRQEIWVFFTPFYHRFHQGFNKILSD